MKASFQRGLTRLREAAAVECPTCRKPVPFGEPKCPACGNPPTVRALFRATFGSLKAKLETRGNTASAALKRKVQWWYFGASIVLLLVLLPIAQGHYGAQAVSFVYFMVLGAFVVWFVPVGVRRAYFLHASRIVKIATTINFVSLLLLIQIAIQIWWGSAVHLAVLFLVTIAAGLVFQIFVLPLMYQAYLLLLGITDTKKDPREQGRTVEFDRK